MLGTSRSDILFMLRVGMKTWGSYCEQLRYSPKPLTKTTKMRTRSYHTHPPNRIILTKDHRDILWVRRQVRFGSQHCYWVVNDEFNLELYDNKLPDFHLILVAGKAKETRGYLWFDSMTVKKGMVVEKKKKRRYLGRI